MYCDAVAADALVSYLPDGVRVRTQLEDTMLRSLPYVFVETTGGRDLHPVFAQLPTLEVVTFAEGSKRDGAELADAARLALWHAHERQTVHAGASVGRMRTLTQPFEQRLDNQPSTVYRFVGTYELAVRPDARKVNEDAPQR